MTERKSNRVLCIFVSVFDDIIGRSIPYVFPVDFFAIFTKDQLSRITYLTITREEVANRIISFEVFNYRIIGCPQCICSPRYARNHFMFNVSFVVDCNLNHSQQHAYEVLVRKLNHYFVTHEVSSQFITNAEKLKPAGSGILLESAGGGGGSNSAVTSPMSTTSSSLQASSEFLLSPTAMQGGTTRTLNSLLADIYQQLNEWDKCEVPVDETGSIHLKITRFPDHLNAIADEDVPLLQEKLSDISNCDLTIQQLKRFIDGRNHVTKIAQLAHVELRLVKSCLQNLRHFGAVIMVPIFLYSASYLALPKLRDFMTDSSMQNECFTFAFLLDNGPDKLTHVVKFNAIRDILKFYSLLRPGAVLKDIIAHFHETCKILDVCRLIRYGELHGLIQRIHSYPVQSIPLVPANEHSPPESESWLNQKLPYPVEEFPEESTTTARKLLDGLHSTDKIACVLGGVRLNEIQMALKIENGVEIVRY